MLLVGLVIPSPCIWLVNRPRPYLLAFIFALIVSGVYSIEQSFFQVGIVFATGLLGYAMRRLDVPILPMVLGVVLGFMVESSYRRSLLFPATITRSSCVTRYRWAVGDRLALLAFTLWRERRKTAPSTVESRAS